MKRTRKITKTISTIRYHVSCAVEKVWRKALFLDKYGWASIEHWLEPADDTKYPKGHVLYKCRAMKPSEALKGWESGYHTQPRREYYANGIHRFIFYSKLYTMPRKISKFFDKRLTMFCFYRARKFEYKTYHYISKKGNTQMDGYLEFTWWKLTRMLSLDLVSLEGIKMDTWDDVLDLNSYGRWGYHTLLVPKKTFNLKDIDKIVKMWYDEKTAYRYHHWTSRGDKPEFVFDFTDFNEDLCEKCWRDIKKGECDCEAAKK